MDFLLGMLVAAGVQSAAGQTGASASADGTAAGSRRPGRPLRAGAAVVDITPTQFPVNMRGLFTENLAHGVHDPLCARAIVVDDGKVTLAIVVVDNIGVPSLAGNQIRAIITERCGIAPENILIAATHTHSAPEAYATKGAPETTAYRHILVAGTAEAVIQAHAARRPAAVGHAVQTLPEEVFNRRWFLKPGKMPPNPFGDLDAVKMNPPNDPEVLLRPAGPTDPDLTVLSVRDAATGRPLAVLANYALHYVGQIPKGRISADYFGEFARLMPSCLEADVGFVAALCNGASGDINNRPLGSSRPPREPFEQVGIVARKAAEAAARACAGIGAHDGGATLGVVNREITLRRRRPTAEQIERANAVLAITAEAERAKLPRLATDYARKILAHAKGEETLQVPLQAMRLGDLALCAIPFEAFVEIGLEIKQRSPFARTMVIGIANGSNGYLPTPSQHELGGYETWIGTNRVQPDASVIIVNHFLEMLAELAQP